MTRAKLLSLLLPPIIFIGLVCSGSEHFNLVLALAVWMLVWWVGEVAPFGVTALLPMVVLPSLSITPLPQVAAQYSNHIVYLFLGGFALARGLEKTQLSTRFCLFILSLTGDSARGLLLGTILSTALLSMWISNTATALIMVPIITAAILFLNEQQQGAQKNIRQLATALFLAIAYAANIGGVLTPVGTPPNVILMGYLSDLYARDIDFWRWMLMAFPVGLIMLGVLYFLLCRLWVRQVGFAQSLGPFLEAKKKQLGPLTAAQRMALIIFSLVCALWIFKGLIHYLVGFSFLHDTVVAVMGMVLLFIVPYDKKKWRTVLEASDIGHLPWNIILLFGGGVALAKALDQVGLVQSLADGLVQLQAPVFWLTVLALAGITIFLTEVMSNMALTIVALPIFMKLAEHMQLDPVWVGVPVAMCASMAFMMPISTPPNAIVFSSGSISMGQMLKAGFVMNIVAICTIMSVGWLFINLL